jgi:hypothetical protein
LVPIDGSRHRASSVYLRRFTRRKRIRPSFPFDSFWRDAGHRPGLRGRLLGHPGAYFFSPAANGAAERGHVRSPGDSSAVEDEHHSFLQPAALVEFGVALTAAVHRPATRLLSSNRIEHARIDASAVTAVATSWLLAPAEGSPLLGGGRVIRRLVHHSIPRPPQVPLASLRILHPLARGVDIIARDYVKVTRSVTRRRELARARSENAGILGSRCKSRDRLAHDLPHPRAWRGSWPTRRQPCPVGHPSTSSRGQLPPELGAGDIQARPAGPRGGRG